MECSISNIIDMHDTWLSIDSIQGCTNGCKYCFLQGKGDNLSEPKIIASASETISYLFSSKYYDSRIPLCLLPGTDPFLNEINANYVKELLEILASKKVSNPIIIITKCLIPDYILEYLDELTKKGFKIVVYLSYSGLGKKYEPNIDYQNIKLNFYNLASRGIRIIHYYRPFLQENSSAKNIKDMLDFVNQYTNISVITGLKLRSDFIDKIDFFPLAKTNREECINASSIWPRSAYDFFFQDYQHSQNVFQTNYCALAQVLEEPCPQYFGTFECKNYNHCSPEQRKRCNTFKKNQLQNVDHILYDLIKRLGKLTNEIEIVKEENNIIIKNSKLTIADAAYLTRILGYKVSIYKRQEDDIHFNSSITNSKPLIF